MKIKLFWNNVYVYVNSVLYIYLYVNSDHVCVCEVLIINMGIMNRHQQYKFWKVSMIVVITVNWSRETKNTHESKSWKTLINSWLVIYTAVMIQNSWLMILNLIWNYIALVALTPKKGIAVVTSLFVWYSKGEYLFVYDLFIWLMMHVELNCDTMTRTMILWP